MGMMGVVHAATGTIRRLSYVNRFSSIPVEIFENVAEHSYWVSVYSVMIHNMLYEGSGEDNSYEIVGKLTLRALSHDVAECLSGDIVRTFKYSDSDLKVAIDNAETKLISSLDKIVKGVSFPCEDNYISNVVKAADFLDLYAYMRREVLRGNTEIRPFYDRMVKDVNYMADKTNGNKISELYSCIVSDSYDLGRVADHPDVSCIGRVI